MLRLHDTLTRRVEELRPLEAGRVSMYSCGPTVYRPVHIGNLRTFLLADVLSRALRYDGLAVRTVMNITDVGHMTNELTDSGRDRMQLAAEDEGLSVGDIAEKYTSAFLEDIAALNVGPFDDHPKASGHIPQIVDLVARLLERGHAYEVAGTVYYDVGSFPGYGGLGGHDPDELRSGHRLDGTDPAKRDPRDFVLWKAAGADRAVVFDSPWGTGYPGWHIECSAMSMHLLGPRFDLHTGGIDLRFPHHDAEIAQSDGAAGHRVVERWVHGEHLLMGESKMAKSAGNVVTLGRLVEQGHEPLAFRMLCFTARYRRQFHFSEDALNAAGTSLRRLRERIAALGGGSAAPATDEAVRERLRDDEAALSHHVRFVSAVHDDLDLPRALTVLREMLADEAVAPAVRCLLAGSWDQVLGLDLLGERSLPSPLAALLEEREDARRRGDFARADALRDRLRAEGVDVIDTRDGTRWVRT